MKYIKQNTMIGTSNTMMRNGITTIIILIKITQTEMLKTIAISRLLTMHRPITPDKTIPLKIKGI